ncbi:head-tail connector protein [Aminobacter aganoensis]|uniref:Putative phiE125 gp8 family phage protein n=1 Tax=Aminobacter aganoensis TaxID=83264 RepID=A0A7X0F5G5_9HYPH|nr:head-tail connector protein [Aminobacter aganoensis]MBB6353405.1 putative phiE125 gp8 family phage protein [Aminobacter aganoensis]
MTLIRTVAPAVEPVTLVDAKSHLRISHTSEDALMSGLIRAAREDVERTTGMALIDQTWRLVLDRWPADNFVMLTRHPVRQVISVTTFGSEGEASVVNPGDYQLDTLSRPARIHFERAPQRLRTMNGVEIDFRTGFGEAGTDVPDLLKRAMLLLVAHCYEFRSSFGPVDQPVSYPGGYDRLLSGYRARRL